MFSGTPTPGTWNFFLNPAPNQISIMQSVIVLYSYVTWVTCFFGVQKLMSKTKIALRPNLDWKFSVVLHGWVTMDGFTPPSLHPLCGSRVLEKRVSLQNDSHSELWEMWICWGCWQISWTTQNVSINCHMVNCAMRKRIILQNPPKKPSCLKGKNYIAQPSISKKAIRGLFFNRTCLFYVSKWNLGPNQLGPSSGKKL